MVVVIVAVVVISSSSLSSPSKPVPLSKSAPLSARNASIQKVGCCVKNQGLHDRRCRLCCPSSSLPLSMSLSLSLSGWLLGNWGVLIIVIVWLVVVQFSPLCQECIRSQGWLLRHKTRASSLSLLSLSLSFVILVFVVILVNNMLLFWSVLMQPGG